jgi:hypothetical protein
MHAHMSGFLRAAFGMSAGHCRISAGQNSLRLFDANYLIILMLSVPAQEAPTT